MPQPTITPDKLRELQAIVQTFQDAYTLKHTKHSKYTGAIVELDNSELPLITLNNIEFSSKNEASMNQQFRKAAIEMKRDSAPSVVFIGEKKVLVDFDRPNIEELFDNFVMKHANVTVPQLAELTHELDSLDTDNPK